MSLGIRQAGSNGFVYRGRDLKLEQKVQEMEQLLRLFHFLLLKTHGDAEDAFAWMEDLKQQGYIDADLDAFREFLKKHGTVKAEAGPLELTSQGNRELRRRSLANVFDGLKKGQLSGQHQQQRAGVESHDELPELKDWEFGDDLRHVDFGQSLLQQVRRSGHLDGHLDEQDLLVHDTQKSVGCATVLLLDVSHSMILYGEDRFTPAKQVALALMELITTRYRDDALDVVLFGDHARSVPLRDLAFASVGPFHTNTKAGLQMARKILENRHQGEKRILMITDGKPTVIEDPHQGIYRNTFGLDPKIVNRTLDEAVICRRHGIHISTFMVARDAWLESFVEKLTELNQGQAYFSSADRVGGIVLQDFVKRRR